MVGQDARQLRRRIGVRPQNGLCGGALLSFPLVHTALVCPTSPVRIDDDYCRDPSVVLVYPSHFNAFTPLLSSSSHKTASSKGGERQTDGLLCPPLSRAPGTTSLAGLIFQLSPPYTAYEKRVVIDYTVHAGLLSLALPRNTRTRLISWISRCSHVGGKMDKCTEITLLKARVPKLGSRVLRHAAQCVLTCTLSHLREGRARALYRSKAAYGQCGHRACECTVWMRAHSFYVE